MTIDHERVLHKTAFIKEQTASLRKLLAEKTREEIINDPWILKGIKYTLQTAVEACIDLAYHLCAKKLGHAPADSRDAFKSLAAREIIPESDLEIYSAMIGFRNRVVHGYQDVAEEQIYKIAQENLHDLDRFSELVLKAVREN
ncbi:MAG: type VII toxin-antitoxin system HepT family RNase toxin [Bacillota bacterium]